MIFYFTSQVLKFVRKNLAFKTVMLHSHCLSPPSPLPLPLAPFDPPTSIGESTTPSDSYPYSDGYQQHPQGGGGGDGSLHRFLLQTRLPSGEYMYIYAYYIVCVYIVLYCIVQYCTVVYILYCIVAIHYMYVLYCNTTT